VNYENPPPGQWRSTVSFVTDAGRNADGSANRGGNFWLYSDGIACDPKYFPRSLIADRIYYNPYDQSPGYASQCPAPFPTFNDQPTTTNAITFVINSGRLMVNYIGHGALQYWADGILFGSYPRNDLPSLTNGSRTPVMLELTCNTGYFIYPHSLAQSFAKLNVNLSGNGAVASWAAVGLGFVSGHDLLEKGFFNAVMNQNTRQLGPATTAGKANLFASGTNLDLIDTTILFGDPASRIPLQMRTFLPLVNR